MSAALADGAKETWNAGGTARRTASRMAHASPDEPDGSRARNRYLDAAPELYRDRPVETEPADDRADRRTARRPASRTQCAAPGGGLCARLPRTSARQRRDGGHARDRRACAAGARALSGARGRSSLEHDRGQRRNRAADRARRPRAARAAGQRAAYRAASRGAGAAYRQSRRMAGAYPTPPRRPGRSNRRHGTLRAARRAGRL